MAYIDKLTNKFNKAKNAVNSLKGIASKLKSIQYESVSDTLGDAKDNARQLLKDRQKSLDKSLKSNVVTSHTKKIPEKMGDHFIYPMHDPLSNYITFDIMPRRANVAGGAVLNSEGERHKVYTRRAVSMYVPDTLISQMNVTYRPEGVNQFNRSVATVLEAFARGGFGDALGATEEQAGQLVTTFVNQTLNKLSGGLRNLKFGRAVNPMQEQLLDGIPFRSFDFTFDFYPKSATEAAETRKIIATFRESMLPDAFEDNMFRRPSDADSDENLPPSDEGDIAAFFNYPNIFRIYFSGPMSNKVDGFLPTVLTNAQVDYAGGQKFSTFEDGQPMHIQLTLNFVEIKVMTLGNYDAVKAGTGDGQFGSVNAGANDSVLFSGAQNGYDPGTTVVKQEETPKTPKVTPGDPTVSAM